MENLILKLTNIEKSFGAKEVFQIPELTVYEGDRIGIIGGNGNGKSTLLKIIQGEVNPDRGVVQGEISFNYFSQIAELSEITNPEKIDWELMSRLKVPKNSLETLSGGEGAKYRLGKTLSQYESGILLDEPTTHLDNESVKILIEELRYYYGTLLFVSHNRHFLNELATKIWEVEDGTVKEYRGNFSTYRRQKKLERIENSRSVEQYLKEKKRLESAISKKKEQVEKAKKVSEKQKNQNIRPDRLSSSKQKDTVEKNLQKSAKSMEARLSQLTEVTSITTQEKIVFPVGKMIPLYNKFPILTDQFSLIKGGKVLLNKCSFQFPLKEKIAIIGKNGVGKSSLLNSILEKDARLMISPKAVFANYQQMSYKVTSEKSILEFLMERTKYPEPVVRSVLHNLGFSQVEMRKEVANLSGGEITRVRIASLFVQPANILVLDEPTNFIDLKTIEALEKLIIFYPGTVLFTSHDEYFVNKAATKIYEIKNQKIREITTSGE